MSVDIDTIRTYLRVCMIIAAVCTTAFPLLYAFSPWYRSVLGRALMIQAIGFALILDITAFYTLVDGENVKVKLWVYTFGFTYIALAAAFLTSRLWEINHRVRKNQEKNLGRRDTDR
jgi:hypothetical protein